MPACVLSGPLPFAVRKRQACSEHVLNRVLFRKHVLGHASGVLKKGTSWSQSRVSCVYQIQRAK